MLAREAGVAYITILPSMKGFNKALKAGVGEMPTPKVPAAAATSAGSRMGGLVAGAMKKSLAGAAVGIGAFTATSLVKGFQRLSALETAEAKLTGLGYTANEVSTVMENALASVKGTAFGLDDAASQAAAAMAAGVKPGKELQHYLQLIGDTAAFSGREFKDVGLIFGKVMAKGKMQGEELNMLAESGIPIISMLAKELGVADSAVAKMVSEGAVTSDVFMRAMQGMSGQAQAMGQTTAGAFKNMGAAMGRFGAALLKGVFPLAAPLFGKITELIDNMTDSVGKLGTEAGYGLTAFVEAFKYGDGEITSIGFPGKMEVIGYHTRLAFDSMRNDVARFGQGFNDTSAAIEGSGFGAFMQRLGQIVAKAWELAQASIAAFALGFSGTAEGIMDHPLPGWFNWIGDTIGRVWEKLKNSFGDGRITQAFSDIASSIGPIAGVIGAAFAHISGIVSGVGIELLGLATGIIAEVLVVALQVLASILKHVAGDLEYYTPILQILTGAFILWRTQVMLSVAAQVALKGATLAWTVVTKAATAAQWLFNAAMRASPIGLVVTAIGLLVTGLVMFFTKTELGRKIWAGFVGFLGDSWNWLKGVLGATWNWLNQYVFKPMGDAAKWLWDNMKAGIQRVIDGWNALMRVLGPIVNWIIEMVLKAIGRQVDAFKHTWNVALTFIGAAFETWRKGLGIVWTWLKNNLFTPFGNTLQWLGDTFRRILDWVASMWNGFWNTLRNVWNWIKQNVFDPFMRALQWLGDKFRSITQWIADLWNWVWGRLSYYWGLIKNAVLDVFRRELQSLGERFSSIVTWIKNLWNWIYERLRDGWHWIRDNVFNPFWRFISKTIPDAFRNARDTIRDVWDGIKEITKKPVKWVIETVINNGILKAARGIAKWIGQENKVPKNVQLPNGFARGGILPGYQRRKKDDVLTPMRSGEGVLVPEAVKALGADFIHGINGAANSGGIGAAKRWADENSTTHAKKPPRPAHNHDRVHYSGAIARGVWGREQEKMRRLGYMTIPTTPTHGVNWYKVGMRYWAGQSGMEIRPGNSVGLREVRGYLNADDSFRGAPPWGFYSYSGEGYLNSAVPQRYQVPVVVHEIGHALSLGHPHGGYIGPSIMGGGINTGRAAPTADDIAKLRSVWGMPGKQKAMTDGDLGGEGGGLWDMIVSTVLSWADPLVSGAGKQIGKLFPAAGGWGGLFAGIPEWLWGGTKNFLKGLVGDSGDPGPGSGDKVTRWTGTVRAALKRAGLPTSSEYVQAWLKQIKSESGGDPNIAQQIRDINGIGEAGGVGLVQVIPGTFRAYRDPGLPDDRRNPLANLTAGMRYAKARYGIAGMLRVIGHGHGYARGGIVGERPFLHDQGGVLNPGVSLIENKTRKPEAILNPQQMSAWLKNTELVAAMVEGGTQRQVNVPITINGVEADPEDIAQRVARKAAWELHGII